MKGRHGCLIAGLCIACGLAGPLSATENPVRSDTQQVAAISPAKDHDALALLERPVTIEFREARLEEVIAVIANATGLRFEPMWQDETHDVGLSKDARISLTAKGLNARRMVEMVLQLADEKGDVQANSWQVSDGGLLQIGPKARLNAFKRLVIYDINDLLVEVPRFADAPELDVQAVLQGTGQGGGTPFKETPTDQGNETRPARQERSTAILELITENIEAEQWTSNGGTGASARIHQGTLIVNAPGYIHRQISGK